MTGFTQLLLLYAWSIPAAVLFGCALSVVGAHLVARNREIQVLCLSQGAVFGVLVSIGMVHLLATHANESRWIPSLSGLAASGITYLFSEWIVQRRPHRKNSIYVTLFIFLTTGGHLVTALFPALDSHLSQAYFGDLATLTLDDAKVAVFIAVPVLLYFVSKWRPLTNESFLTAFFGDGKSSLSFTLSTLVLIAFSIQALGFLFTVACLFIPTTVLGTMNRPGIRLHFWLSGIISAVCIPLGFGLSLEFTRLPTVPLIAFLQVGVALLVVVVVRLAGALWKTHQTVKTI